jgi:two-component system response regulator HydG
MSSVLIVDDVVSIHEMLGAVVQAMGFSSSFATDGDMALTRFKHETFDVVLTDIDMKPMDGIALLKQLKDYDWNAVVIIMTAQASRESAVAALKLGAFDYLQKPFRFEDLIATLRRGFEFRNCQPDRMLGGVVPAVAAGIESRLIGRSGALTKLISHVKKLATGRTPVLLIGEKGTGKSLLSDILHDATGSGSAHLLRIDCALTADADFRAGILGPNGEGGPWVEQVKGGTLVLQQVEGLAEGSQRDLVCVLRARAQDFRLVCTTNDDLESLVDQGKFHDELFYRIGSLPLRLPPLRERAEDIALLVKHFAARAANPSFGASLFEFSEEAIAAMASHSWPGNLAELHQVVSQITATAETRMLTVEHLPLRLRPIKNWPTLAVYLRSREKQYVARVLAECQGSTATAARVLEVGASTLA